MGSLALENVEAPAATGTMAGAVPSHAPAASTAPTPEQHYLLTEKLHALDPSWRTLTHGAIVKLNQEFGTSAVTELIRFVKVDLVEHRLSVGRPYPWMRSALESRRELTKEAAG
jgi:hypothetical protein